MRPSGELACHWAAPSLKSGLNWPRSLDDASEENRHCEISAFKPSQAWQAEGKAFSLLQMACDRIKMLLWLAGSLWTVCIWASTGIHGTFLCPQTRSVWRHRISLGVCLLGDCNKSYFFWKHREMYFPVTSCFRILAMVYIPLKSCCIS